MVETYGTGSFCCVFIICAASGQEKRAGQLILLVLTNFPLTIAAHYVILPHVLSKSNHQLLSAALNLLLLVVMLMWLAFNISFIKSLRRLRDSMQPGEQQQHRGVPTNNVQQFAFAKQH